MAMIQPPKSVTPEQMPGREYIFVVDISGSMNGFPIETSKKLLKELIGSLKPTDVFNVLTFAGSSGIMHPSSVPANKENIAKAISTIENYQGGGGTELLPALNKGLNLPKHDGYSRSFVIATDGYITVEKEAFELMRDKLGDANFFTFGIGSSVNRFLLEGMARVGKGETFVITDPNDAPKYAAKFKKYVESPMLTHVTLNYGSLTTYDVEPTAIPDVLADRPIIVIGKYKGNPTGKITVTGVSGNGKFTTELDLATASISINHSALQYLWARTRVQMLDDYNSLGFGTDKETIKKEVTDLGLKYNMMTAYTSFIAIDERVRTDGNPTTVNQPLPLPVGVSDDAVGGNYGNVNYRTNGSAGYKSKGSTNTYMSSPAPALEETELDGVTISTDNSNQPIISVCDSVSNGTFKSEEVLTVAEVMPTYPGGEKAMKDFIKNNLNYPAKAKEAGISGTVYFEVVVGKDGTLGNSKVARGVSAELDAAALEVVKKLGKFNPGSNGGKPVAVKLVLPVRFML